MNGRKSNNAKRVEWTGAGGDYFLGIVVDEKDLVIAEFWGTQKELRSWVKTNWADLPATWVPMAYTPGEGRVTPPTGPPPLKRKPRIARAAAS
jgi:hypothetical protein